MYRTDRFREVGGYFCHLSFYIYIWEAGYLVKSPCGIEVQVCTERAALTRTVFSFT